MEFWRWTIISTGKPNSYIATASSGGNGNQQQSGGVPQEIMTGGAGGLL